MTALSHILILQGTILLSNLIATTLLAISFKRRIFYYAMALWASFSLQLFTFFVANSLHINIIYESLFIIGLFSISTNTIILKIFAKIAKKPFSTRLFLIFTTIALSAAAIAGLIFKAPFETVASIVCFGIALPSLYCSATLLAKTRKNLFSIASYCLFFLVQMHLLDYPFLRTIDGFLPHGLTIHNSILIAFSIMLPTLLLKMIGDTLHQNNLSKQDLLKRRTHNLSEIISKKNTELGVANKKLLEITKHAGRAEIITGVLHNVGNVLNSINISIDVVRDIILTSPLKKLPATTKLINTNIYSIPDYLTHDPKGSLIPKFLSELSKTYSNETETLIEEIRSLRTNVDHVKNIIGIQQALSKPSGITEDISIDEIINQAIQINLSAIQKNQIHVVKEYKGDIHFYGDRLLLLQIIINLISNAKHALYDAAERLITVQAEAVADDMIRISIADTGVGITREQLPHIFTYGYTTRDSGHGYGLHSSYASAQGLGGNLEVFSDGKNLGATFILTVPKIQMEHELDAAS